MRPLPLLTFVILAAASSESHADVYRYTGSDGVECFTDAPTSGATVVMREPRKNNHRQSRPLSPRPAGETSVRHLPVQGRVTSHTGLRIDPIDGQIRTHNGIDIAVPNGTPVRPTAAGTVIFSGARHGYGNTVMIEHPDGTITVYAHNSENLVSPGAVVTEETTVALSGSTGRSTGPHLHFEAWRNGENLTDEYAGLPSLAQTNPLPRRTAAIKKFIDDEGTVVFTNLP